MTTPYVTKLYDRLDKICDKIYGTANSRVVERILELMPGLEKHGFLLPPGLMLEFPELPSSLLQAPTITQIKLWD